MPGVPTPGSNALRARCEVISSDWRWPSVLTVASFWVVGTNEVYGPGLWSHPRARGRADGHPSDVFPHITTGSRQRE